MVKKLTEIPSAAELWAEFPPPTIAEKVTKVTKVGLHIFRMSEGTDIFGKKVYLVETRDILGFMTDFTQKHSMNFWSKDEADKFYLKAEKAARAEYRRIAKNQKDRGEVL